MSHPPPSFNDDGSVRSSDVLRVSIALVRWTGAGLEVAIIQPGYLPSAVPNANEALDQTAIRIIRDATGVEAPYLEQLYTFSPSQDGPRQIVISYLALFSPDTKPVKEIQPLSWPVTDQATLVDELERSILEYGLVRLRAKLGYTNIARYLLPATFTLSQLQQTYESILNQAMDKRNFRRRIIASGILIDTGEQLREGSHRPAALYRFQQQENPTAYLTPPLLTS